MAKVELPSEWVEPGPGVKRRVLSDSDQAMMVEFVFEVGAIGDLHSHPHLQTTYVASGAFEFHVAGETREVRAGDTVIVPRNAEHGCRAIEAGSLIDTFVPRRDDFL